MPLFAIDFRRGEGDARPGAGEIAVDGKSAEDTLFSQRIELPRVFRGEDAMSKSDSWHSDPSPRETRTPVALDRTRERRGAATRKSFLSSRRTIRSRVPRRSFPISATTS